MKKLILLLFATTLIASCSALKTPEKEAAETTTPGFKSSIFSKGTLVYSDDFDGEFNRERWGSPKKGKQIKDGKLIVTPQFTSREEAMKVLKRDHHLGLEPVVGVFVYRTEVGSGANNWKEVTLADGPTLVAAHKAYRENGGSFKALLVSLLTSDSFLYRTLPADPERNR